MKKSLVGLAVLGAFAGSAMAANVSLYGIVDTALVYEYTDQTNYLGDKVKDGDSKFSMDTGINAGSRFGLKGVEDLGNGYKIGFKLENGFESDTGSLKYDGRLFGREASLSLYSDFGTLSFGRMGGVASAAGTYDLVYAIGDSFDGGDYVVFGMTASSRYDNMITYQTPKFAGLQGTFQYSFKTDSKATADDSGAEGTSDAERYAAFALTGEYGPAQFVAAYERTLRANGVKNDTNADDTNVFYLGGNYDFGVTKVFALAQYIQNADSLGDQGYKGTAIFQKGASFPDGFDGFDGYGLHVGTITPLGAGEWTVGLYYVDGDTDGATLVNDGSKGVKVDAKYYGVATRYVYPFSKRTSLYVGGGYYESKGSLSWDEAAANSKIGTYGNDAKTKDATAYVGLTHTF